MYTTTKGCHVPKDHLALVPKDRPAPAPAPASVPELPLPNFKTTVTDEHRDLFIRSFNDFDFGEGVVLNYKASNE